MDEPPTTQTDGTVAEGLSNDSNNGQEVVDSDEEVFFDAIDETYTVVYEETETVDVETNAAEDGQVGAASNEEGNVNEDDGNEEMGDESSFTKISDLIVKCKEHLDDWQKRVSNGVFLENEKHPAVQQLYHVLNNNKPVAFNRAIAVSLWASGVVTNLVYIVKEEQKIADNELVSRALFFLGWLANFQGRSCVQTLVDKHLLVEAILDCLSVVDTTSLTVVEQGLFALTALTRKDSRVVLQKVVGNVDYTGGGIAVITKSMKQNPESMVVASYGCRLLSRLAKNTGYHKRLLGDGACSAIVRSQNRAHGCPPHEANLAAAVNGHAKMFSDLILEHRKHGSSTNDC
ncbi:expressed unknown protein [Seminavis robusta]|uniref:ARM repeat superfamily protein n=1 Tax=Seminavis robusta TaxID=568900 RepID=A0A9N8HFI4_9STRA|nr:expressed unknown protein [Seminavis robusta]|eukprot:Sro457_g146940.1 n/a (345) ;mRNA; f:54278-55312